MREKSSEGLALIIGLTLIVLIGLVTVFREKIFPPQTTAVPSAATENIAEKLPDLPTIEPSELQKITISQTGVVVLDLRQKSTWQAEHLVDAINLPLTQGLEDFLRTSRAEKFVLLSNNPHDQIARQAFTLLQQAGKKEVRTLTGGVTAWKNLGGTVVKTADPTSFEDQAKVKYLSAEELNQKISEGQNFYLLDVRETQKFNEGHLKNSQNLPLVNLESKRQQLPSLREKIVVIAANENDAFQGAVEIYDLTLNTPFVLKQGFPAWQEKGFEIVK